TRKLSASQLGDWGTAISGHAMRLLEQGLEAPEDLEDVDEIVLDGVSLLAIGLEERRATHSWAGTV
ncbi:hypothetical protein, partial [Saccharothrix sp. ST-888]|uniref:hypothetical protein n=1 Tax=Saccharothrix sp. ST-888 TaxID=1427391 RepID=UPI000B17A27B